MNKTLFFFLLLFTPLVLPITFSQSSIIGKVVDENNLPIPGANITIKGTNTGTVTDMSGKYFLTIQNPESDIIIFSFIGYNSEEVEVSGKTIIDITLLPSIEELDEVVVIGYGTQKKKDLTGSVSSISGEKIKDLPVSSAAEALTGRLAGVQVTTTEGSPDAEVKIRVRGGGSITRDNSPLYIVDGFPVDRISDIPPTDIESYDVLKDASSTAIYGSRGANGVIIITTKKPKESKLSASYAGYYSIKKVTRKLDVLSPYEFAKIQHEMAVLNNDVEGQYEAYFGSYDDINLYNYVNGTDWQDVVFGNTGNTRNHSFSINGGTSTTSFNASYNRVDDEAIMLGSSYKRDNLSLKLNANPVKWFKTGFTVRYSETKIYGGGANDVNGTEKSTSDSRLKNAVIYTPIALKNMSAPGDDAESSSSLYPPTTTIPDNDRFRQRKNYNLNGDIAINFTKWLVYRSEIGLNYSRDIDNRFYGLTTYFVTGGNALIKNHPAAQLENTDVTSLRNSNTLTSTYKLNENNLSLMIGEETIIQKSVNAGNSVEGFPVSFNSAKAWSFTSQGESQSFSNYYSPDDKLLSFFGRLNYDLKGKYYASITYRADGSSKFAQGNQWGYFPSAALAWRVSDEAFFSGMKNWVSNLKLRASYGTAGNNNIDALSYLQVYSSYPTPTTAIYLPSSVATSYWAPSSRMVNEDLIWETTITRNIGLDYGFLKNRFNGNFEMYWNNTSDLLIDAPVPGSGYSTQTRNMGKTSNRGYEITLNGVIIDKKEFQVDFSFNISINKNRVEQLGDVSEINANSSWTSDAQASNDFMIREKQSVGQMFGYVTDGFYSVNDFDWSDSKGWVLKDTSSITPLNSAICGDSWGPGALKLKDLDGNGEITEADKKVIGNAIPKHTGGFTVNTYYKGVDFSINFNWVYGNDIYNANKIEFTTSNKYTYRNMLNDVNSSERWVNVDPATGVRITDATQLDELNANASIWSPILSRYVFHSWAVEDGSFLRLNNITLGYTLPLKYTEKAHIQKLRFYISAYNLHVWTKYSGYDPEVDTRRNTPLTPGVDYSAYPRSRSYNFGVNINF